MGSAVEVAAIILVAVAFKIAMICLKNSLL
jgi:hypothetical protein